MKQQAFQSVVYKEGKYYVAQCLDVDISSFGETEKEALDNLKEALELYFDDSSTESVEPVQHPTIRTLHLKHA